LTIQYRYIYINGLTPAVSMLARVRRFPLYSLSPFHPIMHITLL